MGTTHTVASGETLSHVAKLYGVSWRELAEYNGIKDSDMLRVGQKLIIPPYGKKRAETVKVQNPVQAGPTTPPSLASGSTYVVQSGDNLTRIARKAGVSIGELKTANNLNSDMIRVGQKLTIPAAGGAGSGATGGGGSAGTTPGTPTEQDLTKVEITEIDITEPEGAPDAMPPIDAPADQDGDLEYIVMDGDTLDEIARLFIVSKQSLIEYNALRPDQALTVGQVIKIPPSAL
jgi:LysM repeat protein